MRIALMGGVRSSAVPAPDAPRRAGE